MGTFRLEEDRRRREAEEQARRAAQEAQRLKEEEALALESQGRFEEASSALAEAEIAEGVVKTGVYAPAPQKAAGVSVSKDWAITKIDHNRSLWRLPALSSGRWMRRPSCG